MKRERLRRGWRWILALYLVSFALPVKPPWVPGAIYFVLALVGAVAIPGLFLLWLANPLFWFGLAALRAGRWGRAAAFGATSCALAAIPITPIWERPMIDFAARTAHPGTGAYLAWFISTALLAAFGLAGWLEPGLQVRPQFRLGGLMMVIAAVALALALGPKAFWILRKMFMFMMAAPPWIGHWPAIVP
jgi:hypothetical protein